MAMVNKDSVIFENEEDGNSLSRTQTKAEVEAQIVADKKRLAALKKAESDGQFQEMSEEEKARSIKFNWFFAVAIFSLLTYSFLKFIVFENYMVRLRVDCDPAVEVCFVEHCVPDPDNGVECSENPRESDAYFKALFRKAGKVDNCEKHPEVCDPLVCQAGEKNCYVANCDPATLDLEAGEECIFPEEYLAMPEPTPTPEPTLDSTSDSTPTPENIDGDLQE